MEGHTLGVGPLCEVKKGVKGVGGTLTLPPLPAREIAPPLSFENFRFFG